MTTTSTYLSNQSLASDFDGPAVAVGAARELVLALTWTGSATGSFALQVRVGSADWFTVSDASFTNPAGSSGSYLANFHNVPGDYWRLVFTAVEGSAGSLEALVQSY